MMFPHTKPLAGTQINPLHPLSKGLVGCWLFNEGAGSLANDLSGNKKHGRLTNMAPNVQGSGWGGSKFGRSLKFDGVDDYVAHNSISFSDAIPHTYSMQLKWIGAPPGDYIAPFGDYTQNIYSIYLRYGTNVFRWYTSTNIHTITGVDTTTLYDGEIHHLVWTVNTDRFITVYIDGILNGSRQVTESDMIYSGIGRGRTGNGYNWQGLIVDVRIYNRALSAAEIQRLYLDPFCNMMKTPINRYYVAVAEGLSMAVAMHHYNQMKEN